MGLDSCAVPERSYDEVSEDAEVGPFVLDLCSLAVPVAIPQPRSEMLSRFSFFCSRGEENGRDRYWLHMGYFGTRAEAQKWLDLLRRVYPLASISPAEVSISAEHNLQGGVGAMSGQE